MINVIKMIVGLVLDVLANIIKGIGKIFNNVGTVMTPGSDSKKGRMQYNLAEVEAAKTKQNARKEDSYEDANNEGLTAIHEVNNQGLKSEGFEFSG